MDCIEKKKQQEMFDGNGRGHIELKPNMNGYWLRAIIFLNYAEMFWKDIIFFINHFGFYSCWNAHWKLESDILNIFFKKFMFFQGRAASKNAI